MKHVLSLTALALIAVSVLAVLFWPRAVWSTEEIATLRGLSLASLSPLAPDPSNRYGDDARAAALGARLFFDTRLSVDGTIACATCHIPAQQFQDGRPLGQGVGTTTRRTMPLAGTAYSPWLFWDGRKDSQWAQALGPLESAVEHGGTRTQYAHIIKQYYRPEYEAIFGPLPDLTDTTRFPAAAGPVADPAALAAWDGMALEDREAVTWVYVNIGKAIAAYERQLMPRASRFDAYIDALVRGDPATSLQMLSPDEVAGLRLFIGNGHCIDCHNGPLLTNNDFHNTGVPIAPGMPEDTGRAEGLVQVQADAFNCLSQYSDAQPAECSELRFAKVDSHGQTRQFKPPSLRGVAARAPYMHTGQFPTLHVVLEHYNQAPAAPAGDSELRPLNLTEQELAQLEAFLQSLNAAEQTPIAACLGCHTRAKTIRASHGEP